VGVESHVGRHERNECVRGGRESVNVETLFPRCSWNRRFCLREGSVPTADGPREVSTTFGSSSHLGPARKVRVGKKVTATRQTPSGGWWSGRKWPVCWRGTECGAVFGRRCRRGSSGMAMGNRCQSVAEPNSGKVPCRELREGAESSWEEDRVDLFSGGLGALDRPSWSEVQYRKTPRCRSRGRVQRWCCEAKPSSYCDGPDSEEPGNPVGGTQLGGIPVGNVRCEDVKRKWDSTC